MFSDDNTESIEGVYDGGAVNERIEIMSQDVLIGNQELSQSANLILTQEFLPEPRVNFQFELNDNASPKLDIFSEEKLKVKICDSDIELMATQSNISSRSPNTIQAVPKFLPVVIGESSDIVEVVFHFVNFINYRAEGFNCSTNSNRQTLGQRLSFRGVDYSIVIESKEYTSELMKSLKSTGGYAITHIGKITPLGNYCICEKNINEALEHLYWFFSFVKGSWTVPILPVGYNSNKIKVWEQLGNRTINSWKNSLSWFDPHRGEELPDLFSSFVSKFSNEDWGDHLKTAIYWYINANSQSGGTDGSIILVQAALERLSWVYHVNITRSISSGGFTKLNAADKIRLLVTHANISLLVPENLENVFSFSKKYKFDGPEAFTYIRNRLVHPPKKNEKKYTSKVLRECWVLSLWYLELIILKLLGHNGKYSNRLTKGWAGEVESVPWKNS